MVFREIVVHPQECRGVVVETLVWSQRGRERQPERIDDIQEARHRVGIGAEALERERISGEKRQQRICPTGERERAEGEELVLYERTTCTEVELVLAVFLSEGVTAVFNEFEAGITQGIAECALQVVRAAARRRRNLPAGELTARDIVGRGNN